MTEERKFFLNKYQYDINFKWNQLVEGFGTLYQFAIALPFHLPFPPRGFISFPELQSDDVISTCFDTYDIETQIPSGLYKESQISYKSKISRVEFAYFSNHLIGQDEESMSTIFDRCLKHLNNVIMSYKVKYQDSNVYRVTKEMLKSPSIFFRTVNLETWETDDYLFLLHTNVPYKKDYLKMDEYLGVSQFVRVIEKKENPFILVEDLKLELLRKMQFGEYRESVLYEAMCTETFFVSIYKQLQQEKGIPSAIINTALSYPKYRGIKTFFKEYMPPLLGGVWDFHDTSTEIGMWHENAYKLRNRVFHDGYLPSYTDIDKMIKSNTDFRKWVLDLLKTKKSEYPFTNSLYSQ
ncbi:hypothetical protein M3626_05935 [Psychrobacillus sp. MER TA 17]|nr:hypothetical protein [Psychrobacillus sp. MER TA 17]